MVYQLWEWVLTSPKVTSQGVVLQVLDNCPVQAKQLRGPNCFVTTTTSALTSNVEVTPVIAVIVGVGAVMLGLVVVLSVVIVYVRRKTRATFIVAR